MTEPATTDDPIALVRDLFAKAREAEPADASRFVLATVDPDGTPSARFLLLKSVDERGFGFVTNRESRKGRALANDARAAIAMHWSSIDVQVRVEGRVEQASEAESDAYFATRPRESQIGAWASPQSRPLASRDELEARVREFSERFAGSDVARPPHWGLSYLVPAAIEVWYGRASRLHDRFLYRREGTAFRVQRLAP